MLDVDRFEKWASEYWLPYSMSFDTWAALSNLAKRQCQSGDDKNAIRYLRILNLQRRHWKEDPPRQSPQLAQTIGAFYSCFSEASMNERLNLTVLTMNKEIDAIKQSVSDEKRRQVLIDNLRAENGDSVRPFVNQLLRDGKKDLAEKIHSLLPASHLTMSFDAGQQLSLSNGTVALQRVDLDEEAKHNLFYRFQYPQEDDLEQALALFEKYAAQDDPDGARQLTERFDTYVALALNHKSDDEKRFLSDFLQRLRKLQGGVHHYQRYKDDSFINGSNLALAKLDYYLNGTIPSDETFTTWQDRSKLDYIFYRYLSLAQLYKMIENKKTLAH